MLALLGERWEDWAAEKNNKVWCTVHTAQASLEKEFKLLPAEVEKHKVQAELTNILSEGKMSQLDPDCKSQ